MNCCNQPMADEPWRGGFVCRICNGLLSYRAYKQACKAEIADFIESNPTDSRMDPSRDQIMRKVEEARSREKAADTTARLVKLGARVVRGIRPLRHEDPALLNAMAEMIVAAKNAKPN